MKSILNLVVSLLILLVAVGWSANFSLFRLEATTESIDKRLDTFSGKLEALHGKLDKEERLEQPVAHVINQQHEEHEKLVAPSKERNKTSPMIAETWADTINLRMDAVPTEPNYEDYVAILVDSYRRKKYFKLCQEAMEFVGENRFQIREPFIEKLLNSMELGNKIVMILSKKK